MILDRRAVVAGVLTVLVTGLSACRATTPDTTSATEILPEVDAIVRNHRFPGMTVAIARPDGVFTNAAGVANRETSEPMTADNTMLAASIGKTFVAATLLRYVDENRLTLDDPIKIWLGSREWFKDLPNGNAITIRHLLQHQSGLPDHVYMEAFAALLPERVDSMTPEALIALILDTQPLFAPGEGWAYSDTGFLLLGLIIEEVAGRTYYQEIQDLFITELGLDSTAPSDQKRIPKLARGYASPESGLNLPAVTTGEDGAMLWNPAIEWTGGGLYSTAHDLALWGRAFLSGSLHSHNIFQQAITGVQTSRNDLTSLYGLGVSIRSSSAFGPVYGHRGSIPGYISSLQYYPDYDIAIAFQINTDIGIIDVQRPVIFEIEEQLARLALADQGR